MNAFRPEQFGQLLGVRVKDDLWSASLGQLVRRHQPGGIFLPSQCFRQAESADELLSEICQALDTAPFLWLESEGGVGEALATFVPPLPSPRSMAAPGLDSVERLAGLLGEAMKLLGFNAHCGPTLDLASRDDQRRDASSFIDSPQDVAKLGAAFVNGLARHTILACGKHFPCRGTAQASDARGKSQHELPVIGKSMGALWGEDLIPYRQLLPRLAAVKLSSAAYKAYDYEFLRPAPFSVNLIEGLLRVKLGYHGLVMADAPHFDAEGHAVSRDDAVVRSIAAGCDLVTVDADEEAVGVILFSLPEAVDSGKLAADRVEQALARIQAAKRLLPPRPARFSATAWNRLGRKIETFAKNLQLEEHRIA